MEASLKVIDEKKLKRKLIRAKRKDLICRRYKMSEDFIEQNVDHVDWFFILSYQDLSEKFLIKWRKKLLWHAVSRFQKMSYSFIVKNWTRINMKMLLQNSKVDHEELEENGFYLACKLKDFNKDYTC